jgi:hypothetical protein
MLNWRGLFSRRGSIAASSCRCCLEEDLAADMAAKTTPVLEALFKLQKKCRGVAGPR